MKKLHEYFSGECDPNIQYASIEQGIKAFAEEYSFNIESELFAEPRRFLEVALSLVPPWLVLSGHLGQQSEWRGGPSLSSSFFTISVFF